MRILISSESDEEINSLYRWLQADDDVARSTTLSPSGPGDPGSMGALEVLDVVLSQGVAVANLAMAFVAFRRSRRGTGPVSITRPDGQVLTIGGSPEVTAELIIRFLSDDRPASGDPPQPEG